MKRQGEEIEQDLDDVANNRDLTDEEKREQTAKLKREREDKLYGGFGG